MNLVKLGINLSIPDLVQNLSMSLSILAVLRSISLMAVVMSEKGSHLPGGPKKPRTGAAAVDLSDKKLG